MENTAEFLKKLHETQAKADNNLKKNGKGNEAGKLPISSINK